MLRTFIGELSGTMQVVNSRLRRDLTMRSRVEKKFSMREVGDLLGLTKNYYESMLSKSAEEEPSFPSGVRDGRERHYTLDELMLIRAHLQSLPNRRRPYLHWRQPGDQLKIVTFGAQKGGTGKSLSAAHFAQYLTMNYGLRVGLIDCDPQATASLYFADDESHLFDPEIATVAAFMGVSEPGETDLVTRPTAELDAMWQPTPWAGIRLIPGGSDIQNGDISLFLLAQRAHVPVHSVLKAAIERWDDDYGPKTRFADLRRADGSFDAERYVAALHETVDVIVIDQQPSLTLMQLNGLVAATSVIVPQTMKGFDLSTLSTYSQNIAEYLDYIEETSAEAIGTGRHVVLPTIVQEANDKDVDQIVDLYQRAPELFLQVWYPRSDAVANAAEEYKSIYEYDPPRSRRASTKTFIDSANAVNDALVDVVWGSALPSRGYARDFIKARWQE